MDCLTAKTTRLTGIVKGMEMGMTKDMDRIESDDRERSRKKQWSDKKEEERTLRGRMVIARKTNGERTTENMTCRKGTGESDCREGRGTMGQESREVYVTRGIEREERK